MPDFAKIRIQMPKGTVRHALSMNALDARGRELAQQTFVFVGDKQLLATAFTIHDAHSNNPTLQITVPRDCFELVEVDDPRDPKKPIDPHSFEAMAAETAALIKRDRMPGDRKTSSIRFRPGELRPGRIPNSGRTFI